MIPKTGLSMAWVARCMEGCEGRLSASAGFMEKAAEAAQNLYT